MIGHRINLDGVYEGDNLALLFEWLTPICDSHFSDSCAIDIGANIGNHSVYFSPFFKTVVSFEPNPKTFTLLQLNARLVDNVVCHNAGISDSDREALLDTRSHNTGVSRVSEKVTASTVAIDLRKLDSFVGDSDKVALIKIDVEGHEAQVLRGSEAVIRGHNPFVIFEQHHSDFVNGTTRSIEILKEYGYRNFAVIESYPPKFLFLPRVIRRLCQSLMRLAFGESREIRIRDHIKPGFYPFIVAVPDWAMASLPAECRD